MGNGDVINEGDVQVMSAGTGINHSEFNPSDSESVNFLQLWIFPEKQGLQPRYDQKKINVPDNEVKMVVSGEKSGSGLYINQDASIFLGKLDEGKEYSMPLDKKGYGSYLFILEGSVILNGNTLNKRDAAGIFETDSYVIKPETKSEFIIINVPMN